MRGFDYFVEKIPPNIYDQTRAIVSKNVAIFVPDSYVVGIKMEVEEYHFIICFETPPLATINGCEYQFKKGSLICLAPGDDILVHSAGKQEPAQYMSICVLPAFMEGVFLELGGVGKLEFGTYDKRYSYFLLEALDALIHEHTHYGQDSPLMVASLENRVAIQLIRDGRRPSHLKDHATQPYLENIVSKACKYIELYYTSNITVKDISDAIFVSPSYLQKIFPKTVGKTPHQYIMECRHRKACALLIKTNLSMEEVARQSGFVNSSHFSTTFKAVEGISPLAYRKRHCDSQ